jgi:hypothetical protein
MSYPGRSEEDRLAAERAVDLAFALPVEDREMWFTHGDAFLHRAITQGRASIMRRQHAEPPAFLRKPSDALHEPATSYPKKRA